MLPQHQIQMHFLLYFFYIVVNKSNHFLLVLHLLSLQFVITVSVISAVIFSLYLSLVIYTFLTFLRISLYATGPSVLGVIQCKFS